MICSESPGMYLQSKILEIIKPNHGQNVSRVIWWHIEETQRKGKKKLMKKYRKWRTMRRNKEK
jgi:hypothetical protein